MPPQRTLIPPQAFLLPSTSSPLFTIITNPVKYTRVKALGNCLCLASSQGRQLFRKVGRCLFLAGVAQRAFSLRIWALSTQRRKSQGRSPRAPVTSTNSSSFPCLFPLSQDPLLPFGSSWGSKADTYPTRIEAGT